MVAVEEIAVEFKVRVGARLDATVGFGAGCATEHGSEEGAAGKGDEGCGEGRECFG